MSEGVSPYLNVTDGIERYVDTYLIRMHLNIPVTIPYEFAFIRNYKT